MLGGSAGLPTCAVWFSSSIRRLPLGPTARCVRSLPNAADTCRQLELPLFSSVSQRPESLWAACEPETWLAPSVFRARAEFHFSAQLGSALAKLCRPEKNCGSSPPYASRKLANPDTTALP
jgi:hypothetical protein